MNGDPIILDIMTAVVVVVFVVFVVVVLHVWGRHWP